MIQPNLPSRIVDGLYLGAKEHAEDAAALSACGITHVVNATDNLPCMFAEERCLPGVVPRRYCRVPVRDFEGEGIDIFFPSACTFIGAALGGEPAGHVLVHCREGKSRSATIVLAYLIKCRDYDLASAFHLVRTQRQRAKPNLGFWRQLEAFEKQVRGASSETPEPYVKAKAMDARLYGAEAAGRDAEPSGAEPSGAEPPDGASGVCRRFLLASSDRLGAEAEATVLSRWPAELSGDAATAALAEALTATLVDGSAEDIACVPRLLWLLVHQHGVLSLAQAQQALADGILAADLDELQIDVPHVWRHVANICDGCRGLGLLTDEAAAAHAQVLARAARAGAGEGDG